MFEMKSWPISSTRVIPSPNVHSALIYPYLTQVKDQGSFFSPKVKDKRLLTGRPLARSISTMVRPHTTVISSSIFVTPPGERIKTTPAPPCANMGKKSGGFESRVSFRPDEPAFSMAGINNARNHEIAFSGFTE